MPGGARQLPGDTRLRTHTHIHTPLLPALSFSSLYFLLSLCVGYCTAISGGQQSTRTESPISPGCSSHLLEPSKLTMTQEPPSPGGFQPSSPDLYPDPACPCAAVLAPSDWNPDLCLCGSQAQKPAQAAVYRHLCGL